ESASFDLHPDSYHKSNPSLVGQPLTEHDHAQPPHLGHEHLSSSSALSSSQRNRRSLRTQQHSLREIPLHTSLKLRVDRRPIIHQVQQPFSPTRRTRRQRDHSRSIPNTNSAAWMRDDVDDIE